ncbi:hypothetical protein CMEL01_05470, partial [Colletotrichum melonis]
GRQTGRTQARLLLGLILSAAEACALVLDSTCVSAKTSFPSQLDPKCIIRTSSSFRNPFRNPIQGSLHHPDFDLSPISPAPQSSSQTPYSRVSRGLGWNWDWNARQVPSPAAL